MIHVEAKKLQEHDQGIDPETLEKYMAKVAEKSVKLLEEHTKLINELYEHGFCGLQRRRSSPAHQQASQPENPPRVSLEASRLRAAGDRSCSQGPGSRQGPPITLRLTTTAR